jgi:hypothetical protein
MSAEHRRRSNAHKLLLFVWKDRRSQPFLKRLHDRRSDRVAPISWDATFKRTSSFDIEVSQIVTVTATTGNWANIGMSLPWRSLERAWNHLQVRVSVASWA